jgi:hypothetical protein
LGLENFFVGVGIEHKHVLPSPTIGWDRVFTWVDLDPQPSWSQPLK